MLKGLDPLLNADVLFALRSMGHGDDLIIADGNFPSESVARATVLGTLLRIDAPAPRAVQAVLSVMPVDTFVDDAAARMEVVDAPDERPDVQQQVQAALDAAEGREVSMVPVERFAFYDRARAAYAVIQTAERRFYGCFAFRKGVIGPDAALPGDGGKL